MILISVLFLQEQSKEMHEHTPQPEPDASKKEQRSGVLADKKIVEISFERYVFSKNVS